MAIEMPAVEPGAVRLAVQLRLQLLLELFPGLRRFFGFLQSLPLGLGLQAQFFGPRLGALLLAFLLASVAFAADRLQIGLKIVRAVIVIDIFAGLDVLDGADEHLALTRPDVGFGVRLAGVIDVAGDVLAHRTVDGPAAVEFQQIFVLDRVVLLLPAIQKRPKIADYFGALLDRFGGEEAKPGAGTANTIGFVRRNGRHDRLKLTRSWKRRDREGAVLLRFRIIVRCFTASLPNPPQISPVEDKKIPRGAPSVT